MPRGAQRVPRSRRDGHGYRGADRRGISSDLRGDPGRARREGWHPQLTIGEANPTLLVDMVLDGRHVLSEWLAPLACDALYARFPWIKRPAR